MQLLLKENLCKQRDPQIDFDFDEKHNTSKGVWCSTKNTFNVYVSHEVKLSKQMKECGQRAPMFMSKRN